jgi:hypothetical protein
MVDFPFFHQVKTYLEIIFDLYELEPNVAIIWLDLSQSCITCLFDS